MILINKIVNCMRMLETKQYQTQNRRNEENVWLIAYLRKAKYDKEKIFQIWCPIYRTQNKVAAQDENPARSFERYWQHSKMVKLDVKTYPIEFTEKEIDWINRQTGLSLWMKQYLFTFLSYCKSTRNYVFDYLPSDELFKWTCLKDRGCKNKVHLQNALMAIGFIDVITEAREEDDLPIIDDEGFVVGYEYGVKTQVQRLFIHAPEAGGEVICRFDTIMDTPLYLPLVGNICSRCGKMFISGNKCQRDLCDECWKEKRLYSNAQMAKRWRESSKTTTLYVDTERKRDE